MTASATRRNEEREREGLPVFINPRNSAAGTLRTQMRQRGPDEVDRPDEVRRDDMLDLRVAQLLGRPE